MPEASSQSRLLATVVLGGVLLRVALWWWGGSLTGDEAMLALTIGVRNLHKLISPPLYDQSAPLLFMVSTKLATMAMSVCEHTLRLLPLLSGCLALLLYAQFARLVSGVRIAIGASLLLSVAAPAVDYAVTFKPYSVDLLVAILGLLTAHRSLQKPAVRNDVLLLVLCIVGPWFSASSALFVGSVSVVIMVRRIRSGLTAPAVRVALVALAGALSFLAAYQVTYSVAANSDYMRFYWAAAHPRFASQDDIVRSSLLLAELAWGIVTNVGIAEFAGSSYTLLPSLLAGVVVVSVVASGFVGLGRLLHSGRHWVALLLFAPAMAFWAASAVGLYPLAPRLALCLLPGWLLSIAIATDVVAARLVALGPSFIDLRLPMRAGVVICSAVLLVIRALAQLNHLSGAQELTRWVQSADAPIYVFVRGIPQFLFYSTNWSRPDARRIWLLHELSHSGGPFFENGPSPPLAKDFELKVIAIGEDSLLLGQPDGLFVRARSGWSGRQVQPLWLTSEVTRIGQDDRARVSILALHNVDAGGTHLLRAVKNAGWRCHHIASRDGDFAARCVRPDDAASTPAR